ncbi:helix-turn-helix domain-containing protein [Neorhizobium sp. NPDC001467]|uniref:helix-turn-helix domain-containing protein n=1 Tax=Neorhizobium sp. NPDC001467 TaxID=3390595 RepID=UPI003D010A31
MWLVITIPWFTMGMEKDGHSLRKIVAKNMRVRRAELDITQEELAMRTGLTQAYLSGIEREKRNASLDSIQRIAAGLDVDPADLLRSR